MLLFRKRNMLLKPKIKDEGTIDNTLILKSIYYIDINTGTNVKINVFII